MPLSAEHQTLKALISLFETWNDTIFKNLHVKWVVEPEQIRAARALLAAQRPTEGT